jgi:hypothetical protein
MVVCILCFSSTNFSSNHFILFVELYYNYYNIYEKLDCTVQFTGKRMSCFFFPFSLFIYFLFFLKECFFVYFFLVNVNFFLFNYQIFMTRILGLMG